jgi:hypothetical protein
VVLLITFRLRLRVFPQLQGPDALLPGLFSCPLIFFDSDIKISLRKFCVIAVGRYQSFFLIQRKKVLYKKAYPDKIPVL